MKATRIIAKRKSLCPECRINIYPGVPCQVYDNKWYHVECWQEQWDRVTKERDDAKVIGEVIEAQVEIIKEDKEVKSTWIDKELKQLEYANELRGLVLQVEVLTGRMRHIAKEMGSW